MSRMSIRGSEYPVKKIFSDDFVFTIPLYQRPYSWTTEQSEEMLQDLLRAMEGPEETIDELAPYFLGSVVLIKGDEAVLNAIFQKEDLSATHSPLQLTAAERDETLKKLNGDMYLLHHICRYILLRLDAHLSDGAATYDFDAISVEHVLPQRPAPGSQWRQAFPTKEIHARYVHRLGNLVLLSRGKNSQAENFDFELKKSKYFCTEGGISSFRLTTQVIRHKEWTPEIIEQRQTELIGHLKKLWRL